MGTYGRNDDRRPLREFDGPLEGGRFRVDHGTRQQRAAAPQRTGAPQQKLAAANRRPGTAPRARRPKSRRGKMAIIGLGIVIAFVAPQRTGAPQQKLAAANRRPGTAPRARRPKSRRGKMAIIGLGIVIAFVLAAQSLTQQNVGTGRRNAPTQEETAHSTPTHAWRKGEVPCLYQIDPQWSDEPYAGGNIHENGCGPTCLSMVYISLTGKTGMLERAEGTHQPKRKPLTRHQRTPGARERSRSCTKSTPNGPTNPMREGTSTRTDAARPAFPWSTYRSRERPTSIPWQWRASASKTASPSTA